MSLKEYGKKIAKIRDSAGDRLVKAAADFVEGRLIKKTPVDTGTMRASWAQDETATLGDIVRRDVYNDAPYAEYVEYGHAGKYVPALGVTLHTATAWTEGINIIEEVEESATNAIKTRLTNTFREFFDD